MACRLSLLFASGNNGVWGTSEAATLGNGRHKRALNYMFRSEFPASSPYVTSVGGTDWQVVIHPLARYFIPYHLLYFLLYYFIYDSLLSSTSLYLYDVAVMIFSFSTC